MMTLKIAIRRSGQKRFERGYSTREGYPAPPNFPSNRGIPPRSVAFTSVALVHWP
jgi:hypothetical protein